MRSALPLATLVLCALIRPTPAVAQETPTERTAAADVIRRVNDLERSLALPQLVARLTGKDPRRDAVVARARELMERELLAVADDITRHPEVGHKEERSVKILTEYLKAHDFAVEMGVVGLATAFVARYRNGTPGHEGGRQADHAHLDGEVVGLEILGEDLHRALFLVAHLRMPRDVVGHREQLPLHQLTGARDDGVAAGLLTREPRDELGQGERALQVVHTA